MARPRRRVGEAKGENGAQDQGWALWAVPASIAVHSLAVGSMVWCAWIRPAGVVVRVDPRGEGPSERVGIGFDSTPTLMEVQASPLERSIEPAPGVSESSGPVPESDWSLDVLRLQEQLTAGSSAALNSLETQDIAAPRPHDAYDPSGSSPQVHAGVPQAAVGPQPQAGNPAPIYPDECRRKRQEGTVTLRILVTAEGFAKALSVEQSSGFALLDQSALTAAASWRFDPARENDRTLDAEVLIPIRFSLRSPITSQHRR